MDEGNGAAVAQALVDAWQSALGLQVTARSVSREELDTALQEGTFTLAGTEIRALGNDAECFLMQWGSDKPENLGKYANSAYDTLLSVIAGAEEGEARMGWPPRCGGPAAGGGGRGAPLHQRDGLDTAGRLLRCPAGRPGVVQLRSRWQDRLR